MRIVYGEDAPEGARSVDETLDNLIRGLHAQKAECEVEVIESLLSSWDRLDYANLTVDDFEADDLRLIYECIHFLAKQGVEDELVRLGFILRILSDSGMYDAGAISSSRSSRWGERSLVNAARSWPAGTTAIDITVPRLKAINAQIDDARAYYICLVGSLRGAA